MSAQRIAVWLLAAVIGFAWRNAAFGEEGAVSRDEATRILAHGPWPMPWTPDPSNRVSGNRRAADLGRKLFFDEGLSQFGALSCASCHKPRLAWSDGRSQAASAAGLERNTLSLFNVRHMRWLGWDGAANALWAYSLRPLLDAREMAASAEHVRNRLVRSRELAKAYAGVFGEAPSMHTPEEALANAAKALAAFQEGITTARSPFDAFRDALAANDRAASRRYPDAALRGLRIFIGKGSCSACHSGPMFTNGEFYNIGIHNASGRKTADSGREGGLKKLREAPFALMRSAHDDSRGKAAATPSTHPTDERRHPAFGAFRVPSLRNVALTAPYMHDGSMATLDDAVRHCRHRTADQPGAAEEKIERRIPFTKDEIADLVAFLRSLTAAQAGSLRRGR